MSEIGAARREDMTGPKRVNQLAGVLVATFAWLMPCASAHAGRVTFFSEGISVGAQPYAIAPGPDGSMWFTENADGIAEISRSGQVTEYRDKISPGSTPAGIAAGAGGVWFTESAGNRIGRIDADGNVDFWTIPSPNAEPNDIVHGVDGNMWFTERHAIGMITPEGAITEFPGIPIDSYPWEITQGPDRNLWFTDAARRSIWRLTPAGALQEFRDGLLPTSIPNGIAPGPDLNVWFTDLAGAIGRITPDGAITRFTGLTPGARPTSIAPAPDNKTLWYTDNAGRIGRITTGGTVLEFPKGLAPEDGLLGIAPGHDGNLWFTAHTSNRVGFIEPDTAVFYTAAAKRRGRFLGKVKWVEVSAPRGTPVSVVCVAGCARHALRGAVPRDSSKPPYATLRYPKKALRVGRRTTLEVRGVIDRRVTRFERFRFVRRSGRLMARRIDSGCIRTARPSHRATCPAT
jgi:streptogramin lyase